MSFVSLSVLFVLIALSDSFARFDEMMLLFVSYCSVCVAIISVMFFLFSPSLSLAFLFFC